MPFTALASPGPSVVTSKPGAPPMALAPAAIIAAAVSLRARINAMPARSRASISVTTSPPGMPKAKRMPAVILGVVTLFYLTDVYGPRLTGSPNITDAGNWAVKKMQEWGLPMMSLETTG